MAAERFREVFEAATREIAKVIVGQEPLVEGVLVALFSEGSVLLEGAPGLGKTLLVNTVARAFECDFKRVQFTPDLMPSDLTGHSVYDLAEKTFRFVPGPIFTNLLLADEVNRSPAKTQSALLEVMQEKQVTVDGETRALRGPFQVVATQNPLEYEGTYPLPEAQIDRFMFKLLVDYPTQEQEIAILGHFLAGHNTARSDTFEVAAVASADELAALQREATRIIVEPSITHYITAIVGRTRAWPSISVGASPRASIGILLGSRTLAACRGRDFVVPDDVKEVAPWVLRHRLRLRPEAEIEGVSADDIVREILEGVEAPSR
ncbi:MAG: AAA family ATPase [Planctomycetota bacterium]